MPESLADQLTVIGSACDEEPAVAGTVRSGALATGAGNGRPRSLTVLVPLLRAWARLVEPSPAAHQAPHAPTPAAR